MRNKLVLWIVSIVVTIALSVSGTLVAVTFIDSFEEKYVIEFNKGEVSFSSIKVFNEVIAHLENEFVDGFDMDEAVKGATAGIAASVKDPYTMYVPEENMQSMMERSTGNYIGIGVIITNPVDGPGTLITTVYSGGPADQIGVLPGDLILSVDGKDVSGVTDLGYIASIVKGEKGTDVTLGIYRAIEGEEMEFIITRDQVNSIEVEGRLIDDHIGYIRILSFSQDSDFEFLEVVKDLTEQGMDSIILDLRDNGGGDYGAILNIANMFIDSQLITYTIDKDGNKQEQYARGGKLGLPTVVLVNEYSASASEMLTGALKDHDLATIIGETTYGKGSVQAVYTLSDGSGLRVTVAKYYTPGGTSIHEIGITPDEIIEQKEEYSRYFTSMIPPEDDLVYLRAIEIIQGQ